MRAWELLMYDFINSLFWYKISGCVNGFSEMPKKSSFGIWIPLSVLLLSRLGVRDVEGEHTL